jgi:hypothetical protein
VPASKTITTVEALFCWSSGDWQTDYVDLPGDLDTTDRPALERALHDQVAANPGLRSFDDAWLVHVALYSVPPNDDLDD